MIAFQAKLKGMVANIFPGDYLKHPVFKLISFAFGLDCPFVPSHPAIAHHTTKVNPKVLTVHFVQYVMCVIYQTTLAAPNTQI